MDRSIALGRRSGHQNEHTHSHTLSLTHTDTHTDTHTHANAHTHTLGFRGGGGFMGREKGESCFRRLGNEFGKFRAQYM